MLLKVNSYYMYDVISVVTTNYQQGSSLGLTDQILSSKHFEGQIIFCLYYIASTMQMCDWILHIFEFRTTKMAIRICIACSCKLETLSALGLCIYIYRFKDANPIL